MKARNACDFKNRKNKPISLDNNKYLYIPSNMLHIPSSCYLRRCNILIAKSLLKITKWKCFLFYFFKKVVSRCCCYFMLPTHKQIDLFPLVFFCNKLQFASYLASVWCIANSISYLASYPWSNECHVMRIKGGKIK